LDIQNSSHEKVLVAIALMLVGTGPYL